MQVKVFEAYNGKVGNGTLESAISAFLKEEQDRPGPPTSPCPQIRFVSQSECMAADSHQAGRYQTVVIFWE